MTTDPLGDFFREIHHRIGLYPDVAPAGDIWPSISTYDLYNVWLRDSQNRRELSILKEERRVLREENSQLRTALVESCGTEPKGSTS